MLPTPGQNNADRSGRMIEDMVENRETKEVRKLLEDEAYLRNYIPKAAAECHSYAVTLGNSLKILEISRNCLSSSTPRAPRYELLPRALRGDLHVDTPMVRELLLLLKKMNSTSLLLLLNSLADTALAPALAPFQSELETLASEAPGTLTSEFDVISSTLRSTAVSKKIQLNAHKSGLTKNDAEYSRLVQKVHEVFHAYFDAALRPVEDIFLHEMFFYDLISPHRDVFAPRARATVERALCRPVDYLGCECCELNEDEVAAGEDGTMKRSHPPTSIVYQLYLEGGTLINGFDLWNAFRSVVMGEDVVDEGEKEEGEEERVGEDTAQWVFSIFWCAEMGANGCRALFYRSVAELKVLGFVKPTRKRVDHLQKLAWKGL